MTVLPVGAELLPRAAELFDEYRRHYGHPAAPLETAEWLRQSGLLIFAAPPGGLVTVLRTPASLRLGVFWQVRDLYVRPTDRRAGVARRLLTHVIAAAREAGALRVSLQTEDDNAPALALYASLGFRPVDGFRSLSLDTN